MLPKLIMEVLLLYTHTLYIYIYIYIYIHTHTHTHSPALHNNQPSALGCNLNWLLLISSLNAVSTSGCYIIKYIFFLLVNKYLNQYLSLLSSITLVNKKKVFEMVLRHQISFLANLRLLNLKMILLFLG